MTFSEVNYFGLAGLLIDQHGKDAMAHAVRLREEAVQAADPEAVADWHTVEQAIGLLTNDAASAGH